MFWCTAVTKENGEAIPFKELLTKKKLGMYIKIV
jgi:hypothetical protein